VTTIRYPVTVPLRVLTEKIKKVIYFIDTGKKKSYSKNMKNRYITQSEYQKQLAQEASFVKASIVGLGIYTVSLILFWMALL
jgi:hypothetical protein